MKFLGVEIIEAITAFFQSIRFSVPLEYLLYIFIGVELLTIIIFIVVTRYVYELKLMRAVDKINAYLYEVQFIDESNLIEFNNKMKKVPKTLRYHWQQYMLYREKSPSYYMSIENCIDRPLKSSVFESNIKVIKYLGIIYAILAFIFSCGWASGLGIVSTDYFINVFTIPVVILFLNYIFLIALNVKKSSTTSDLYQTFHIFNRFMDKAVSTLPEYVDFEVLFTRKEIKRGIPVLNEYIEKRQIQEQEEMRRAKENAVQHELYNFEAAGEKGELVLERAMKETEVLVSLRNRLNSEIEQIEKEIESCKRGYENATKDYQKKLQASKENIERLREQQEATTNRIESNYIRKQQSDEIKKQQQIEKEQDDATLRFNQEINSLTVEIKKRKDELEGARMNVEKSMLSEYKTFANKIFLEVKDNVSQRIKEEREELINSRGVVAQELEEALTKVEQLEKQNKFLVTKAEEREAYIRAELEKENKKLLEKLEEKDQVIEEKEQHISLISGKPIAKTKAVQKEIVHKGKEKAAGKTTKQVIEGEFSLDDKNANAQNKFVNPDGLTGEYDGEGNYRFPNGTYFDAQGNFHDENGNIFDPQGNLINQKPAKAEIKKPLEEKEEVTDLFEFDKDFSEFDVEETEEVSEESEAEETDSKVTEQPTKRRGRPRKEKTEVVKSERKRGRPKKIIDEDIKTEKRGRGRPKKIIDEDIKTEKRGRGRPKKEESEVKPTGKRGRPKKDAAEKPKPAGKRGRPRKNDSEVSKKPAKGRGRPKKINMDEDLKDIEAKLKEQNNLLKAQHKDFKRTVKKVGK